MALVATTIGKNGAMERRRTEVAKLYCHGKSMAEISKLVHVTKLTVFKDMEVVRERWRERADASISVWMSQELAKLDHIEVAAWEGWERSVGSHVKTVLETIKVDDGERRKNVVTDTPLAGDPRYLDVILRCVQRRCRMLGLDAPEKIEDVTPRRTVEILVETKQDAMTVQELIDANQVTESASNEQDSK